jgi:hypothetical protein
MDFVEEFRMDLDKIRDRGNTHEGAVCERLEFIAEMLINLFDQREIRKP